MGYEGQRGGRILPALEGEDPQDTWASGGLTSPPSREGTHLKEVLLEPLVRLLEER